MHWSKWQWLFICLNETFENGYSVGKNPQTKTCIQQFFGRRIRQVWFANRRYKHRKNTCNKYEFVCWICACLVVFSNFTSKVVFICRIIFPRISSKVMLLWKGLIIAVSWKLLSIRIITSKENVIIGWNDISIEIDN